MADSAEDICNQALAMLVENTISSLDDGTDDNAILCAVYFPQALDTVLSAVKPRAAQFESELAVADANFEANEFQMAYRYRLPTDPWCLRVLTANGKRLDSSGTRIIGRLLESNDETMFIRYLGRVTQFSILYPETVDAIAYDLAGRIAVAKQLADTDRQRIREEYMRYVLPAAHAAENQDDAAGDGIIHESSWNTAIRTYEDDYQVP